MSGLWHPTLICNSGGPMSRTREEIIASSVLGKRDAVIRCRGVICLALDFEGRPALATVERIFAEQLYPSVEDLRVLYEIPQERLICRVDPRPSPLKVCSASPEAVLEAALMLGLCTQVLYDPSRPVLWTEASLTRRLELFDPEGFYA